MNKDIQYWVDTAEATIDVAQKMCDTFHDNRIEMDNYQKEYFKIAISAAIFSAYNDNPKNVK